MTLAEEWAYEGNCHPSKNQGVHLTSLFYPDTEFDWGTDEYNEECAATVSAYCLSCPVIQQCRAYADRTGQDYGIWGGQDYTRPPGKRRKR